MSTSIIGGVGWAAVFFAWTSGRPLNALVATAIMIPYSVWMIRGWFKN